jgi:tRNA(Phe) wybutosine-synthesizing methylase Tyw3
MTCNENDRGVKTSTIYVVHHLVPIYAWHDDIQKNKIKPISRKRFHGLLTTSACMGFIALVAQQCLQAATQTGFVINNEDLGCVRHDYPLCSYLFPLYAFFSNIRFEIISPLRKDGAGLL